VAPRDAKLGWELTVARADIVGDSRVETGAQPSRPILEISDLSKTYRVGDEHHQVLAGISLQVIRGEFVCIVGPSGAGKSTLLRCIAGLLAPSSGTILLDAQPVHDPPPKLAVVFQDYSRSLMPWMSVASNVMLPLRSRGYARSEQVRRADEALAAVGLTAAGSQYPWQLSGGMQQRVAIARALAYEPEAMLMDEPFASVDAQTRSDLEDLILRVRHTFGMTVLLVTHDIDESVYLADRVIVMGGSPTSVREQITVDLPSPRDQVSTKLLPRFSELRAHVMTLIREDRVNRGV
jgi:NitT/TauT family transport system ATP-binding protein